MAEIPEGKLLFTVKEAAGILEESEDTVRGWLRQKILEGIRTGDTESGNWRILADCLRHFEKCKSYIKEFTGNTQVFWITWKENPYRSDCEKLLDRFRTHFADLEINGGAKEISGVFPPEARRGPRLWDYTW